MAEFPGLPSSPALNVPGVEINKLGTAISTDISNGILKLPKIPQSLLDMVNKMKDGTAFNGALPDPKIFDTLADKAKELAAPLQAQAQAINEHFDKLAQGLPSQLPIANPNSALASLNSMGGLLSSASAPGGMFDTLKTGLTTFTTNLPSMMGLAAGAASAATQMGNSMLPELEKTFAPVLDSLGGGGLHLPIADMQAAFGGMQNAVEKGIGELTAQLPDLQSKLQSGIDGLQGQISDMTSNIQKMLPDIINLGQVGIMHSLQMIPEAAGMLGKLLSPEMAQKLKTNVADNNVQTVASDLQNVNTALTNFVAAVTADPKIVLSDEHKALFANVQLATQKAANDLQTALKPAATALVKDAATAFDKVLAEAKTQIQQSNLPETAKKSVLDALSTSGTAAPILMTIGTGGGNG